MIVSLDKPALDELTHYGVLGMKWGVRKKSNVASLPKTKAEKKREREIKTKRSKAILIGSAAAVTAGFLVTNKLTKGELGRTLASKVPDRVVNAGKKTMGNTMHWKWNSGVSVGNMAFSIIREFAYNLRA